MDISLQKRISARHRAVLAGLGVLGCCVFANLTLADVSSAAVPTGVDCSATEGKISGRGSTYQTVLLGDLSAAYSSDFCGSVTEQYAGDPAGSTMLAYNYAAAEAAGATGSGAGLKAASCRTDAFWGTDTPYTEETNSRKSMKRRANTAEARANSRSSRPTRRRRKRSGRQADLPELG